jgi:hypothetical protein
MAQSTNQEELGSVNQDQLPRFWRAVEQSSSPVTVLAFGDSVSLPNRSIQLWLFQRLEARLGAAGLSFQNSFNKLLYQMENGTWGHWSDTNWWTPYFNVPPNGALYWTNQESSVGSLTCDQLGVFYIAYPGGGRFTLSVSTNDGPWSAPLLSVDGYSPEPSGHYSSLSLPPAPYRLRVDGVTGTNMILGPQLLDTTSSGINIAFMAQDGANLNEVMTISTNVLYPVLSALNPQLVVWHMKEVADIGEIGLSNRLVDLESLWRNTLTNGDVVYVGTPWQESDLDPAAGYTLKQNRLVREAALRDHRAYIDCMTPCVSYQYMTNHAFLDDVIHPSNLGDQFMAGILWQELGFFALRIDRQLTVQSLGSAGVRLAWATSSGVIYDLQSSADLSAWASLTSVPGNDAPFAYTNSMVGTSNVFYRLSLSSP